MTSVTAIVLAKDEEQNILPCLRALSWANEIIVYDSGSSDETIERARKEGASVVSDTEWSGFGCQRQKAQQHATSDWVLMIDADERVTPELAESIKSVLTEDDRNKAFALPRLSWCFGRFIRHSGWYPDYVLRLYPRERCQYNDNLVHESLVVGEKMMVTRLRGDLIHYTYKDLNHYLVKSAGYAAQWAEQHFADGKRATLWQGTLHGFTCFLRMYLFRAGFLDGRQGLLLAILSAHSTFVKYAALWLKYQPTSSPPS